MVAKPKFDYESYKQKAIQFVIKNRLAVTIVVILVVIGFSIFRVSLLSNPSLDQELIDDQSSQLTRVQFDEEAIERIQKLKDSGVDIESEFSNRENPFNE